MSSLKVRIPLGIAGVTGWFWLLAVTEFPWWFTLAAGLVVGRVLTLFSLKPLLLDATPETLPEGFQVKVNRDRGIWPTNVRWCVIPDPYTTPSWCIDEWSILDELAHGWSLTRRTAQWRGNRAVQRLQKERSNGGHRQAQASPRSPGSGRAAAAAGATITATGTFAADEGTSEDELETVQSDLPILAHRAAKLRFHGDGRPWDSVTDYGNPFGVDARATCNRNPYSYRLSSLYDKAHGATPSIGCSCGFYAMPPDLSPTYGENGRVTLLVELAGRVIEHEMGYRAEHQRVVECRLPACRYCGRTAAMVDVLNGVMVQAVCAEHVPDQHTPEDPSGLGRVWLTVEDVARTLPVPLTLDGDRDGDEQ